MSLVTQKIANFLGGISQRPPTQRLPTQAEEQLNGLSSLSRGVMKRPPSKYVGTLTSEVTGWDNAFIHVINRDEDERYHVVVANGDVKVFDAVQGVEVPVIAPEGTDYLEDTTGKGFRAVTVGDTTFIVNRGTEVERTVLMSPDAVNEALIYVRQADFSTAYTVNIDGFFVSLRTVDQDEPASRRGISTEAIAKEIHDQLVETAGQSGFVFNLNGSTIHVFKSNGSDFTLSVSDGLSDNGLKAIKGEVQSFEDLPARAVHGFVVEITGSIDTAKDNYFVKYDDLGQPGKPGVWRECPKPGTPIELDKSTMPHRLALRGEVGVEARPHQGITPQVGTLLGYVPAPVEGDFDSYELPLAGASGHRTQEHLGGGTITAGDDYEYFVAPHNMLDITSMELFGVVYVRLYKNDVLVHERRYANEVIAGPPPPTPGDIFPGAVWCQGVSDGDVFKVRLEYESGETPPTGFRCTMLMHNAKFYDAAGRTVVIGSGVTPPGGVSAEYFPIGTTITLTLDGVQFTASVTTSEQQALLYVMATLRDAVDAHANFVVQGFVSPDRFYVTRTDGVIPSGSISGSLAALTFFNDSLRLTPGDQVGNILTNVTDGSTGVITANGERTITVASLTGGADNTIAVGDLCAVFVDPDVGTHFVFGPVPWKNREAGDTTVVPFPSFLGSEISDMFFYQNRLGFLCKENVIFSSAGDLFNLFRYTATDFRADDAIDVRSAHADVTIFDSAFLWSGGLYVKSDNVWFSISGEPALTPTTIRLDPVGRYPSSKDPRPVVVGDRAFFTRAKSGKTQVFEIVLTEDGASTAALDITKDVPEFLEGTPVAMAGDGAEGFLAVLTSANEQRFLYIYSWLDHGDSRVISSWSKWEFAAGTRIIGLDMADGVLGILRKHADGCFLDQIDLDLTPDAQESIAYLDRRVHSELTASGWVVAGNIIDYNEGTGTTTWTLPYAVATDGSEGTVMVGRRSNGVLYTVTRPTPTTVAVTGQGDLSSVPVYIGVRYTFRYKPTTLYLRAQNGIPETAGRLQIRYLDLFYKHTTDFTLTVAPTGRPSVDYIVDNGLTPTAAVLHVPVLCQNEEVELTITNTTPGPCALAELDWEGYVTTRSRRL